MPAQASDPVKRNMARNINQSADTSSTENSKDGANFRSFSASPMSSFRDGVIRRAVCSLDCHPRGRGLGRTQRYRGIQAARPVSTNPPFSSLPLLDRKSVV